MGTDVESPPIGYRRVWPFTFEKWLELPENDGNRYELLDGVLLVSPGPLVAHQLIFSRIMVELARVVPDGLEVMTADLRLAEDTAFMPDILVAHGQAVYAGPRYLVAGDIALAVEIVSRSSRKLDRFLKPAAYAEAGVPYYWRVEQDWTPDGGAQLFAYQLAGESYQLVAEAMPGRPARLRRPFPVILDPARWTGPRIPALS